MLSQTFEIWTNPYVGLHGLTGHDSRTKFEVYCSDQIVGDTLDTALTAPWFTLNCRSVWSFTSSPHVHMYVHGALLKTSELNSFHLASSVTKSGSRSAVTLTRITQYPEDE